MKNFEAILREIAELYGITPEEVYRQMREVVDAGFDSDDPSVRAAWKQVPYCGERPTPEEVIRAVKEKLRSSKEPR